MERKHFIPSIILKEQKRLDSGYYPTIDKNTGYHFPLEELAMKSKIKQSFSSYKDYIISKCQYLDFTGMEAMLSEGLGLEKLYVPLRVRPSSRIDDCRDIDDFKDFDKNDIDVFGSDFEAVFQQMYEAHVPGEDSLMAVILGQPGSGKTTLLKWLALQCINQRGKYSFENLTPVFISLKDLARDPDGSYREENILEVAMDIIAKEYHDPTFLNESFTSGKILFLLDGLDEVADEILRAEVIRWIQLQDIHKNCMLVTSRFSGLRDGGELNFRGVVPLLVIQDFNDNDKERFLRSWFETVGEAMVKEKEKIEDIWIKEKANRQVVNLIAKLESLHHNHLLSAAHNPQLLTMIALIHERQALLPSEGYQVVAAALRVMIEMCNEVNRMQNTFFSVRVCMRHLARLAVLSLKEHRQELDETEIEAVLPQKIENQPLDIFLREMGLKSGVLYRLKGNYGFTYRPFQEYLAAWYYAVDIENQNQILAHRLKDSWIEVYKFYVNLADARVFFNQIIADLEEYYWVQMTLWEDCLASLVDTALRKEIELMFCRKIFAVLTNITYDDVHLEQEVIYLFLYYGLYKHASLAEAEGWQLFHHARHPFLQSVGSSILNRAGESVQAELMAQIKARIMAHENENFSDHQYIKDSIYRDNNSFLLLIAGRKNLWDFHFVLTSLKSRNSVLVYLNFLFLRYVIYLKVFGFLPGFPHRPQIRFLQKALNELEVFEHIEFKEILDHLDLCYLVDFRFLLDMHSIQYYKHLRSTLRFKHFEILQSRFETKYKEEFFEKKEEIHAWADHAIATLHSLSDLQLKKYFPGTTAEELARFRKEKE